MPNSCAPFAETKSTCPYCGVGCGVIIKTGFDSQVAGGRRIIEVKGDPDHPANFGRLCSKGSKLAETTNASVYDTVRATQPMMRQSKDQKVEPTTWFNALDHVAERFTQTIAKYGPDSVAFYISGQLLTEDYYVFNKLAKGLIGTNNVDTNSRLCMSSAVSGYKRSLGADAPPCSYEDIELADCVMIAGSNMAWAHPVAFRRLEAARERNPQHKLIVVDPRLTDTARLADLHLAILPGTDVMLFNAMLHVMLRDGLLAGDYIAQHTEGFEHTVEKLKHYTPALASSVCGVPEADIEKAAQWFAQSDKTLSLYCQGLNQASTGTDKNTALIALHLATGKIGRAGCGPFSLTGQPNAMGGREVGGLATLLPAHRELSNSVHRQEVASFWGVQSISETPGADAVALFDRLEKGEIKAVWIACTNPAHSIPNSDKVARALKKADLVIVQDAYLSPATVQYADVLLPATTWGEKEGTVTNSERRITRVRAAIQPAGFAKHDWQIATDFARLLEMRMHDTGLLKSRIKNPAVSMFPWNGVEQIFNEHKALTQGRDLDITGLSYDMLEQLGPQQWPVPAGAAHGKARLYEEGVYPTASGKAQFIFADFEPVAEDADARFPWRLNTGRLRDQWHGASRTGTLPEMFSHESEPAITLHPADAKRLMLSPDDWVTIQSRRGRVTLPFKTDDTVKRNQAYVPMHWGPEYFGGKGAPGGVNALTVDVCDPYSKQPELKHAAVRIEKAKTQWKGVYFLYAENWLALWLKARQLFAHFDAALCVPVGRSKPGVLFRAVHQSQPSGEVLEQLLALFGKADAHTMRYSDPKTGDLRHIGLLPAQGETGWVLNKVALLGNIVSEGWLRNYFDSGLDVTEVHSYLLSPSQQPPGAQTVKLKTVCNCVGVSDQAIDSEIETYLKNNPQGSVTEVVQSLKCTLKCGTECGSCVPELRNLAEQARGQRASSIALLDITS